VRLLDAEPLSTQVVAVRGNVHDRLARVASGELEALVMARAGAEQALGLTIGFVCLSSYFGLCWWASGVQLQWTQRCSAKLSCAWTGSARVCVHAPACRFAHRS
jgi:hypothetical protein